MLFIFFYLSKSHSVLQGAVFLVALRQKDNTSQIITSAPLQSHSRPRSLPDFTSALSPGAYSDASNSQKQDTTATRGLGSCQ